MAILDVTVTILDATLAILDVTVAILDVIVDILAVTVAILDVIVENTGCYCLFCVCYCGLLRPAELGKKHH